MTDLPIDGRPLPARLGVGGRITADGLVLELTPSPHVLRHGIVRASVLAYLVDAVAGIPLDLDSDDWTFTTDLSIRTVSTAAPTCVVATNHLVRDGHRSATSRVALTTGDGSPFGTGVIGFARTRRRDDDPAKHGFSEAQLVDLFDPVARLDRPLRDEAGIRVVDDQQGIVEIDITPDVCNPAGTLQGAMVALVAEAAAEDLVGAQTDSDVVVTDLDLRYLARTGAGPVRTRARMLRGDSQSGVEVELVDTSTGVTTTHALARTTRVD